ncbi:glycerate kinase type-2 family protein [Histidinibacterium aquaticum]|uniref:DUF4147 domain-containing protein n=1 Tax=Histidinibacterium aquaticum TaxID=2613962 RepID=A0A5J5GNR6_9RHOB|nr:DUF4147 domain-containing protein [Histidinibacterium aquaticum]KAA9009363.1 DUF4147 domain-containing protein [Histidinibacterium aquaticum]
MWPDPRAGVTALYELGVAAADPRAAVTAALPKSAPDLVLALGKAAGRMAEAALEQFPGTETLVVTTDGAPAPGGAEILRADHPVPGARSLAAGERIWERLGALGAGERLLVLLSGGASALVTRPVEGVSLEDKRAATVALLGSGASIEGLNLVRQNLSRLKGGGLVRRAMPAEVTALILSDVIGDDISAIGSGPTAPALGTAGEAKRLLERLGIWDDMPETVRAHLTADHPAPGPIEVENRLIGSNAMSLERMQTAAPGSQTFGAPLLGDVADVAGRIVARSGRGLLLWGGEPTVKLGKGDGLGGRSQELALRIALLAEARRWPEGWVCLCGGSDGIDGPTDAAGGIVDAGSLDRMRAAGVDPEEALARNDSYHALKASGDLLITGPTGTNVADLGLLWRP